MFNTNWGTHPKTALLLHGLSSNNTTWARLKEHLENDGFTVHTPDLPGHGTNRNMPLEPQTLDNWCDNLIKTHSNKIDLLVGHSLGALIAGMLQNEINPKHTILISPILRLPHLVNGARFGFKLVRRYQALTNPATRAELKQWNPQTATMLTIPNTRVYLKPGTLIIRPKGSWLVPNRATTMLTQTEIITLGTTHHPHLTHHEEIVNIINTLPTRNHGTIVGTITGNINELANKKVS